MRFRLTRWLGNLFALWVVIGTSWAWLIPEHFLWFVPYITEGLGLVMLSMGMTLTFSEFRTALSAPRRVLVGVAAQFLIMPTVAFCSARAFGLSPALTVGLVLVGSCPGGTASNVIAFLAKADVPVSVLFTMSSTLVSVVATPLLVRVLVGTVVPVDAWAMFRSMVTMVLLPLLLGVTLNQTKSVVTRTLRPVAPIVAMALIVLIVGSVVALRRDMLRGSAVSILLAVATLHIGGFVFGYVFARALGQAETFRRTVSIEVGMQNGGLGAALAQQHFAASPLTAVPSAASAVVACIVGSFAAAVWAAKPVSSTEPED